MNRRSLLLIGCVFIFASSAKAGTFEIRYGDAVALAAQMPSLGAPIDSKDRVLLDGLLDKDCSVAAPSESRISLKLAEIQCAQSMLSMGVYLCSSVNKDRKVIATVHGRAAHELLATLKEADSPIELGAGMGWYRAVIRNLDCEIDMKAIAFCDGVDASKVKCTFEQ